jgi:hypothetical protein
MRVGVRVMVSRRGLWPSAAIGSHNRLSISVLAALQLSDTASERSHLYYDALYDVRPNLIGSPCMTLLRPTLVRVPANSLSTQTCLSDATFSAPVTLHHDWATLKCTFSVFTIAIESISSQNAPSWLSPVVSSPFWH